VLDNDKVLARCKVQGFGRFQFKLERVVVVDRYRADIQVVFANYPDLQAFAGMACGNTAERHRIAICDRAGIGCEFVGNNRASQGRNQNADTEDLQGSWNRER